MARHSSQPWVFGAAVTTKFKWLHEEGIVPLLGLDARGGLSQTSVVRKS
jgi:hypothetical protein